MSLLQVEDIGVQFGGVVALDGLTFDTEEGQVCALIGPNGAGKTTLFNVVSRIYDVTHGALTFDGNDLLNNSPHRIAELGISRTFQNLALVPGLSVLDNVLVGAHIRVRGGFLGGALKLPHSISSERKNRRKAEDLLARLALTDVAHHPCAGLPYGTLKRIELARGLASEPRLLMLDEPASGLTHAEVDELSELIRSLPTDFGVTVLLVEHHMGMVMGISDKVVVLDFGRKIAQGLPEEVASDPLVIEAYLGGSS